MREENFLKSFIICIQAGLRSCFFVDQNVLSAKIMCEKSKHIDDEAVSDNESFLARRILERYT